MLTETEFRTEHDTMGPVQVPADMYWGAQTERSRNNFKIGGHRMPDEVIRAFAHLKKAAAFTNLELGVLPANKTELIRQSFSFSGMANWFRHPKQYEP
jgi:fumarate hydratase, class II